MCTFKNFKFTLSTSLINLNRVGMAGGKRFVLNLRDQKDLCPAYGAGQGRIWSEYHRLARLNSLDGFAHCRIWSCHHFFSSEWVGYGRDIVWGYGGLWWDMV